MKNNFAASVADDLQKLRLAMAAALGFASILLVVCFFLGQTAEVNLWGLVALMSVAGFIFFFLTRQRLERLAAIIAEKPPKTAAK